MHPRRAIATILLLGSAIRLVACNNTQSQPKPTVAFVAALPNSGYQAFNAPAEAGLEGCRSETGTAVSVASPASEDDVERQLLLLATENTSTIVALGYPAEAPLSRIARRFDTSHFAIVDTVVPGANIESIIFDEWQGAFLAGALAAMMSKDHRVAFLGGVNAPVLRDYRAGFAAGARTVDPHVRVDTAYVGSFQNTVAAQRATAALFGRGDDVIYVAAGKASAGAIAAARVRTSGYIIGADTDQDGDAPGKVLTSVVKNFAIATRRACLETASDKSATGTTVLGLAEGGIALTAFPYTKSAIGPERLARLDALRSDLITGKIKRALP
jgi:basic membrane protein A